MGFIRGGGLVIVGILLFLSLLIGNILFVFSSSLGYDNLKTNLGPVMTEIVSKEIDLTGVEEGFEIIKEYCETHDDFVLGQDDYVFTFDCDEILASTPESIIESESEKFLEKIYYKDYDCGFIDCFQENEIPFFIISEQSKDYLSSKSYYFLFAAIVFIFLIFLLVENKINTAIIAGSIIIVSSLPFAKLDSLASLSSTQYLVEMMALFFTSSSTIFWTMFIIGIVSLGAGIGFKVFKAGKFVSKKIKKKK